MRVIPLALVALLGLAPLAQAQQQPYGPNPDSKSLRQHYVEGRLDIARVIYKTDLWSACGISRRAWSTRTRRASGIPSSTRPGAAVAAAIE